MSSYEYLPQNKPSLDDIRSEVLIEKDPGSFKLIFSFVDLTTLNTDDTESRVKMMCEKMNKFPVNLSGIGQ